MPTEADSSTRDDRGAAHAQASKRRDCAVAHVLAAKSWELGRSTSLLALRSIQRIEPWFLPYPIRNVVELSTVVLELVGRMEPGVAQEEIRLIATEVESGRRLPDHVLLDRGMTLIRRASGFCERPSAAHAHSWHLLLFLLRAAVRTGEYEALAEEMSGICHETAGPVGHAYRARYDYERASALRYSTKLGNENEISLALYRKALDAARRVGDPQFGMDHIVYGAMRNLFLTSVDLRYWSYCFEIWQRFTAEFPDFGETHLPLDYEFLQALEGHRTGQLGPIQDFVIARLLEARGNPEFPLSVKNRINRAIVSLRLGRRGEEPSPLTLERERGLEAWRMRTTEDFQVVHPAYRQVLVVSPRSSSLASLPPRISLPKRVPPVRTCV